MKRTDKKNKVLVRHEPPKIVFPPELIEEYKKRKIEKKRRTRAVFIYSLSACLVFIMATTIGFVFSKVPASKITKGITVKQEQIVVRQKVKWITLVDKKQISSRKYLTELPRNAENIKISSATAQQAKNILTKEPTQQLSLLQRQQLASNPAQSSKVKQFFSAALGPLANDYLGVLSNVFNPLLTDVIDGVDNIANIATRNNDEIVSTADSTYVNVSSPSETPSETLPEQNLGGQTETTPTAPSTGSEQIESPTTPPISENPSDYVAIEYETPAPQIVSEATDTGQQVTVSATNEDPQAPLVDVLASTKIPEIFKVGQENKIKIKWKSNNNQEVAFHAYDTDNNGYLDYVEWTIPHLSDQIFNIIYISKAFQLDAGQNIMADIYDQVKSQDDNYALIADGQYVRVTFETKLNNTNDNTIYAEAADHNLPAAIEVYPAYTDADGNITDGPLVATFNNISEAKIYKILLTNLQTPTDVFDLKVMGNVKMDYIVDPASYYWIGGNEDNGFAVDSWDNPANWQGGILPPSGANIVIGVGATYNAAIPVGYSVTLGDVTINNANFYDIVNFGTITDVSGTFLNSGGSAGIDNYGTIDNISGIINNSSSNNVAGIWNETDATITDVTGTINNSEQGQAIYNDGNITNISGIINNTGTGNGIYNGGNIANFSGTLNSSSSAFGIFNNGTANIGGSIHNTGAGSGVQINAGTVGGTGIIYGTVIISADGTLNLSAGLTVTDIITNNSGAVTEAVSGTVCSNLSKTLAKDISNTYGMCILSPIFKWIGGDTSNGFNATSWDNPANWQGGILPPSGANIEIGTDATTNAIIPVGYSNNGGSGVTLRNVTISSASKQISNLGTITDITGTVTNSSGHTGVVNEVGAHITDISGTFNNTNSGSGTGIDNKGTITDISGTYNDTSNYSIGLFNEGTITDISGTYNDSCNHTYGIYNAGIITDISGHFINSGHNSSYDYGIYNGGTIIDISGIFTNSGINLGIYNSNNINDISGTFTNSGGGTGIINGISATIDFTNHPTPNITHSSITNNGTILCPVSRVWDGNQCSITLLGNGASGCASGGDCLSGFCTSNQYCSDKSVDSHCAINNDCDAGLVCTAGVCVESAVNIPVTGVTLSEHTTAITVGDTHQLIATIAPGNASNPGVSWSSNNTAVATVNSSGLVTAVGAGSATILVTTTDGNYTDTTVVTVSANSGSSGGGGVNRLQLVINLANQTINQIKQSVANIFRGKINSPVQPTTTPPTDLQPPPPPTTQTQTVTTENQNMIIVIYQKIITAIISLFNSLFGK